MTLTIQPRSLRLTTALIFITSVAVSARPQATIDLDSLLAIHHDVTRSDSTRAKAMLQYLHERRYCAAADSLGRALDGLLPLIQSAGQKREEATAWNLKGIFQRELGEWDKAEACYMRSYSMWERIGDSGRMAGLGGVKKFLHAIWAHTLSTANRMEGSGAVGRVNISEATYALVRDVDQVVNGWEGNEFPSHPCGLARPDHRVEVQVKSKMEMQFASIG